MEYFVLTGHDSDGPFDEEHLLKMWGSGILGARSMVRPEGQSHWTPFERLFPAVAKPESDPPHSPGSSRSETLFAASLRTRALARLNPLAEAWE
ncbi:MAG: DUF4339 domain-containing protein [Chthoniobacteraceae bacterium]